jgi:hypothetical protein
MEHNGPNLDYRDSMHIQHHRVVCISLVIICSNKGSGGNY